MNGKEKPIGVFDSGIGGLSVLKQAVKVLPNEDFIYFGDSKNAPYGTKNLDELKKLVSNVVEFLISKKVKAILVACNTATSATVDDLRKNYDIPIIGIEPALKPAVELHREGKILVMATPVTLSEKKFNILMEKYKKDADIVPFPCGGLAELIEKGDLKSKEITKYLTEKLKDYKSSKIASIVLGCTHYPFIKSQIHEIVNKDIPIIDGSLGTSKQLKRQLINLNLLSEKQEKGYVHIYNSLQDPKVNDLSYKLMTNV
ncbi:glutamate racemase [Haloimpatiens sp. FM7330]|uniref:glutamate racemase n=1 Tax=Haloimpatiens sp. FM7330 TaxID=3298610 RepID=UPI0036368063